MYLANLILLPLTLALAAPNAAAGPEPTAAPIAQPALAIRADQQFSFSIPGLGGTVSSGVACGHIGKLSGCAGPSGASGNAPGYTGVVNSDGVSAAVATTTTTSTSTDKHPTASSTKTGTSTTTKASATGAGVGLSERRDMGVVMAGVGIGVGGFVWGLL